MFTKRIEKSTIREQPRNTCMMQHQHLTINSEEEEHIKPITLILTISRISMQVITIHSVGSKIMLQIQLTEPTLQSK